MLFSPQSKPALLKWAASINPVEYARTRNYIKGSVTKLSPYFSRGVIATRDVMMILHDKGYSWSSCESLLKELAWRDYFQRVQQHHPDLHRKSIKQEQSGVAFQGLPLAVMKGKTGIEGIDKGIHEVLISGYMHNHQRMYTAMLCCNIGQYHWKTCADWLYYHLIDGDVASNYCSWQWTAGAFSSKRYIANQENINHYSETHQQGTFLDADYDALREMAIPNLLKDNQQWQPFHWSSGALNEAVNGQFPEFKAKEDNLPIVLYNTYQLNQEDWVQEPHHKVLLLEPSFFQDFPISHKVMNWILSQAAMIEGLTCFVGEWNDLSQITKNVNCFYVEHPLFLHYEGTKLERPWMFPEVNGYYPSFFGFWKQVEKRYTW